MRPGCDPPALEVDLSETALILSRRATDTGDRIDEAITAFGFDRAGLDAGLAARRADDGLLARTPRRAGSNTPQVPGTASMCTAGRQNRGAPPSSTLLRRFPQPAPPGCRWSGEGSAGGRSRRDAKRPSGDRGSRHADPGGSGLHATVSAPTDKRRTPVEDQFGVLVQQLREPIQPGAWHHITEVKSSGTAWQPVDRPGIRR